MSSARPSSRRRKHEWICEEGSVICQNERDRTRHMLCMSYVISSLCILFSLFMRNFEICKASLIIFIAFLQITALLGPRGAESKKNHGFFRISVGNFHFWSNRFLRKWVGTRSCCGLGAGHYVGAASCRVTLLSLLLKERLAVFQASSFKFHM